MKCNNCGKEINPSDPFCPYCGMPQGGTEAGYSDGYGTGPEYDPVSDDTEYGSSADNTGNKGKKGGTALIILLAAVLAFLVTIAGYFFISSRSSVPKMDTMTYEQLVSDYSLKSGSSDSIRNAYYDRVSIDFEDMEKNGTTGYKAEAVIYYPDMEEIYEKTTDEAEVLDRLDSTATGDMEQDDCDVRVDSDGKLTHSSAVALQQEINEAYMSLDDFGVSGNGSSPDSRKNTGKNSGAAISDDDDDDDIVYTMYVSASDGYANVRSGRGTGYSILGRLENGTSVKVEDLENNWYEIASGKYAGGYVSSRMLSSDKNSGSRSSSAVTKHVSQPDGYANVRKGRGTQYAVVGTIDDGDAVSVTNLQNGWYEIASGPYSGYYISSKTIK